MLKSKKRKSEATRDRLFLINDTLYGTPTHPSLTSNETSGTPRVTHITAIKSPTKVSSTHNNNIVGYHIKLLGLCAYNFSRAVQLMGAGDNVSLSASLNWYLIEFSCKDRSRSIKAKVDSTAGGISSEFCQNRSRVAMNL